MWGSLVDSSNMDFTEALLALPLGGQCGFAGVLWWRRDEAAKAKLCDIIADFFRLLKNVYYFHLLVLKGIYHYWIVLLFFSCGLSKWRLKCSHFLERHPVLQHVLE